MKNAKISKRALRFVSDEDGKPVNGSYMLADVKTAKVSLAQLDAAARHVVGLDGEVIITITTGKDACRRVDIELRNGSYR